MKDDINMQLFKQLVTYDVICEGNPESREDKGETSKNAYQKQ